MHDGEFLRVFASYFSIGPPGDRGALHCRWNVIATQPLGLILFQARGILPVAGELGRTRGSQSGGVEDQPQFRGLWHRSSPNARSLSHFSSPPPPSFTQSPSPPRSLVRDGQTGPQRPRASAGRLSEHMSSTLPLPPRGQLYQRHSSNTHTPDHIPRWAGGWVLHQPPWSFGSRGTRENRAPPCVKVPGSSRVPPPTRTAL